MSKPSFIKSTIVLTIATLVSKILGSIFRIPLQNIAGDEVLGIFSLVYPVYMVALILSVAGIPIAISKLIAEARTENDQHSIRNIYITASILAIVFGILSFSLIVSFSSSIATMLGGNSTRLALIIVSLTLLIAPYMAVYRGYFQGFEDMRPTAVSQVIEQLIRAGLIIAIAYYLAANNYSDEIIAGVVMVGSIVGAIGSLIFLRFKYNKSTIKAPNSKKYSFSLFKIWSKKILSISIPIVIGAITMALFNFVDSFTVPYGLKSSGIESADVNYWYGIYSRGITLVQIATVFATSVVLPLVPAISAKLAKHDLHGTRSIIEQTHTMTHIISWPVALGLFTLTLPLNLTLFTNFEGSSTLAIIELSSIFTCLALLSTGILQGINLAKVAAFIILGGVLLKVVSNLTFLRIWGLDGAALSTLLVYIVIVIANSYVIWKKVQFSFVNLKIIKSLLAAIVMATIIGIPTWIIDFSEWNRLEAMFYILFSTLIGILIYFIQLILFKVVDKKTLQSLPILKQMKWGIPVKKRLALWITLILLLVISLPGVINRWSVENTNNNYEIVTPYEEIYELVKDSTITMDEALQTLKEAGLTTVSISPFTLSDLERLNIVTIFDDKELSSALQFTEHQEDLIDLKGGLYITIPAVRYYNEVLVEALTPSRVTIANQDFYYLAEEADVSISTVLGYDALSIQKIEEYQLNYILRAKNSSPESNEYIINSLLQTPYITKTNLLFTGNEVLGYPNTDQYKEFAQQLTKAGYSFYTIEFSPQKGLQTIASTTDYNVIRLHSINLAQKTLEENINQAIRAIKERNIRSVLFHFQQNDPEMNLENAISFIEGVHELIPGQFEIGPPLPYKEIQISNWGIIVLLIAGILFTFICTTVLENKWIEIPIIGGMALLGIAYILLDRSLFLQGFAFGIAVITPVFAVISTINREQKITLQYVKSLGINFIGILIVIGLLNGNAYITGFEVFKGVKLLYILPIVLTGIILFLIPTSNKTIANSVNKLLHSEVKYWHLFLLLLVGAIGFYYISRTGNAGSVSEIELLIRHKLEEYLYVRPRTKEFLIGFPLYLLGLYVFRNNELVGKVLLLGSIIGFLSMMNTFTHFHIPLYISLLRTGYSIVLGFVIGMLLIYLYKVLLTRIKKKHQKRWI